MIVYFFVVFLKKNKPLENEWRVQVIEGQVLFLNKKENNKQIDKIELE